jgi:hypothetical protein
MCAAGALVGALVAGRGVPSSSWREAVARIETAAEPLRAVVADPTALAGLTIAAVCVLCVLRPKAPTGSVQ